MKTEGLYDIKRRSAAKNLVEFFKNETQRTGLCYLRGRRRVGKSTLLKSLTQNYPIFYFSGILDESTSATINRFAKQWGVHSKNPILEKIKKHEQTWDLIFDDIIEYAKKNDLMLAFDEIQWIAKNQNGFIGTLKNKWIDIEKTGNVRLIICGSSNKFFKDYTGGEEQILRGLKTRSDIVLQPFSISEVYKNYFSHWKLEEVFFTYMLIGGIPYYLNQIGNEKNFVQSLNQILFTNKSIFLEEVDEILRLEFNQAGLITIKKILATLGMRGKALHEIQHKTKLAPATLTEAINKLLEYSIVYEKKPALAKSLEIKRGVRYVMKDFYLNTYFQILRLNRNKIKNNISDELLINSIFNWPLSFYYVENFSGEGFENLVEYVLGSREQRKESIFKKLNLDNINFEIGTHWDKKNQIDIVLHECDDQQVRLIECKWTSSVALIKSAIPELVAKSQKLKLERKPILALIIPIKASKTLAAFSKKNGVVLISQSDLIF